MNVIVVFSDGSREQLNGVDDKYREDVKGLIAITKQKFPNKTIVDIKYPKVTEALPAVTPQEANIGRFGDKNRWVPIAGGYWHNLDTHEVELR